MIGGGTQGYQNQVNHTVQRGSSQLAHKDTQPAKEEALFNPLVEDESSNVVEYTSPSKVEKSKHKIKKLKSPGGKSKVDKLESE